MTKENTADKINQYFALQQEVHEYFGYNEDWKVIPMVSELDSYWMTITDANGRGSYAYSEEPFTVENIEKGENLYGGVIYMQRFLPKYIYRTENHTMVSCDTQCDDNKMLMVFDNSKECVDPELKKLYMELWGNC